MIPSHNTKKKKTRKKKKTGLWAFFFLWILILIYDVDSEFKKISLILHVYTRDLIFLYWETSGT